MQNKITHYLKITVDFLSMGLAIIAFIFNDYDKLKNSTIMEYIIEHWNWWVIAILFAIWVRIFRIVIREDIKETHNEIIKSNQDLQRIFMPDLAINNIFIREVLIKSISEDKFYDLLEKAVFEERKFNIPDLDKFGIDEKIIKKLKAKYHEIETKKLQ